MKYMFLTGAPGSMWSSIARLLYDGGDFDLTDQKESYTRPGGAEPMHVGHYWGPMVYNSTVYDRPFVGQFDDGTGIRLIKSHEMAHTLDEAARWNRYSPIIMVLRPDFDCVNWWYEAGGFDITYPDYSMYMGRLEKEIRSQNEDIRSFIDSHSEHVIQVKNSKELGETLHLNVDENQTFDMDVFIYLPGIIEYFADSWSGHRGWHLSSHEAMMKKVDKNAKILDVGCGDNNMKDYFPNLTGIDPANPKADFRVALEEFDVMYRAESFDVVFALGSLNFGRSIDVLVECGLAVHILRPGGTIYFRCNPGSYDHAHVGLHKTEIYPWTEEDHIMWSEQYGCDLITLEWEGNDEDDSVRLYAEWRRR